MCRNVVSWLECSNVHTCIKVIARDESSVPHPICLNSAVAQLDSWAAAALTPSGSAGLYTTLQHSTVGVLFTRSAGVSHLG